MRSIWKYVHAHFADDFDFFHIGGHDLYVLPQVGHGVIVCAVRCVPPPESAGGRVRRSRELGGPPASNDDDDG